MSRRLRKILVYTGLGALLTGLFFFMLPAAGRAQEKQLVISVVEELPPMEIEDNPVPLAGASGTKNSSENRHLVIMACIFLAVVVYVLVRSQQEKRRVRARLAAARREAQNMKENGPGNFYTAGQEKQS